MAEDFEIYQGKTFGALCKDIVKNSEEKKQQIDVLITDLREMIKTIENAVMVVPLLKEYYDVGVRNDEQLIKLAAIVQRLVAGKMGADGDARNILLTDEEKKQLMSNIESTVKALDEKVKPLDKTKLPKAE
jgi:hypothetical protein